MFFLHIKLKPASIIDEFEDISLPPLDYNIESYFFPTKEVAMVNSKQQMKEEWDRSLVLNNGIL